MDGNKKTILQLFRNQSINQSINYCKSLTEKSKHITTTKTANKQTSKQQSRIMAAILCTTIGELISTACKALTIPCRACGAGCDKLGELICTPFMPYLIVTFFLNTPAVVYAVKSSINQSWNCSYELFRWLIINAILSIIHMIASFYIVNLIREEKPSSLALPTTSTAATAAPTFMATTGTATTSEPTTTYQNAGNNNNFIADSSYDVPGGPNSFQRIKHVLCYDKGMAVYIVIFLFWIVWLAIGVSRRLFYDNDNDYDDGCGDLTRYMNSAIAIGYVWMALVGTAFCCSLICLR